MKNSTYIHLIRHGQTIWNHAQRLQGRQDIPLSEIGEQEAQQMVSHLKSIPLSFIGASPLYRTQQTASIISDGLNMSYTICPELIARSYGSWEGKEFKIIRKDEKDLFEQMKKWSLEKIFTTPPLQDIESYKTVSERVLGFLKQTAKLNSQQHMLMVTHSGVISSVLLALKFPTNEVPLIGHHGRVTVAVSDQEMRLDNVEGLTDPNKHAAQHDRIVIF